MHSPMGPATASDHSAVELCAKSWQNYTTNGNCFTFFGRSERFSGYFRQETCLNYFQDMTTRKDVSKESADLAVRNTNSPRFSTEVCITSLNSHFHLLRTRHKIWLPVNDCSLVLCYSFPRTTGEKVRFAWEEKSYSTRVTEYDKSDTALYLKVGAAK